MNLREWALPVYTILIQLATGALLVLWVIRLLATPIVGTVEVDRMAKRPTLIVWLTILVAILGAHFHLSRPFLSFLVVLNVRASWLSREILFTALFFLVVCALCLLQWFKPERRRLQTILGWTAIAAGMASTYCMSQIYLLPTQVAWDSQLTVISFLVTALLLGVMAMSSLLILDLKFTATRDAAGRGIRMQVVQRALAAFGLVALVLMSLIVLLNLGLIVFLDAGNDLARLSLQLLLGLYRPLFTLRVGLLVTGVGWLVLSIMIMQCKRQSALALLTPAYMACLLVLIGEILGRFLFYATHIRVGI